MGVISVHMRSWLVTLELLRDRISTEITPILFFRTGVSRHDELNFIKYQYTPQLMPYSYF